MVFSWWWMLLGCLLGWSVSWFLSRRTLQRLNSRLRGYFDTKEGHHLFTVRAKDAEIARLRKLLEDLGHRADAPESPAHSTADAPAAIGVDDRVVEKQAH